MMLKFLMCAASIWTSFLRRARISEAGGDSPCPALSIPKHSAACDSARRYRRPPWRKADSVEAQVAGLQFEAIRWARNKKTRP